MFLTALIMVASLVLVEYEATRMILLFVSLGYILVILVVDMAAWANPKQLRVFYLPVLLESSLFGIGVLLLFF